MKNLFIVSILSVTTSALGNTLQFNIDDVDTISTSKKSILVEDLRDGFEVINDVQVSNETITIKDNSKVKILFKSGLKISPRAISAKVGGDMGGG